MVNELSLSTFDDVINHHNVVFVDFFATWCGPCRAMMPIVEELASEYQDKVAFYKVDVDKEEDLAEKFNIHSIPTFLIIKDGKIQEKIVGMRDKKDLVNALNL